LAEATLVNVFAGKVVSGLEHHSARPVGVEPVIKEVV
jgi:hypothetical protein